MAARAPGASSASSGHDASQALTSERRATGTTMPTVPATRPATSSTASRVAASRSATPVTSCGSTPVERTAVGQVGVEPDPLGVRRGVLVDLGGVAVVGREVELVDAPCPRARRRGPSADSAGHRPRRLRRVADDRPGRGPAAAADHPPLHRREVLRLVDEHVGERVVLDAGGSAAPRPGPAARTRGRPR